MRRELFLAFLFVIICVASIAWAISSRTASDEFARLVSRNTEQVLSTMVFNAQEALQAFPNWKAWQLALIEQREEMLTFLELPNQSLFDQQIYIGTRDSTIDSTLFFDSEAVITVSNVTEDNAPITFFDDEDYIDNLLFGMLLDLEINNLQLLVVNNDNIVVIDSHNILLNQSSPNLEQYPHAIILGDNDEAIGRLYIILQNDVYTAEQIAFLENTQRGNLYGALAGAVIALVLAIIFANQIIRPVSLVNQAMLRASRGHWGHQVDNIGRYEIREIGQTFNQLSQNLLEQQNLRTRLVNDIAHEINTPLNLIRLEIESLLAGLQTPEEAHHYLNQEIDTLTHLLGDLIFLANEQGKPNIDFKAVDLNELLARTVRRFDVSDEHDIEFSAPNEAIILQSNAVLIERAMGNLLSNALRYSPNYEPIQVLLRRQADTVEIWITDKGIGIDEAHLSHIFERFYRVDEARQLATGGRGLGLAIVKEIMQQLKGEVLVESRLGQGSTFKLVFVTPKHI